MLLSSEKKAWLAPATKVLRPVLAHDTAQISITKFLKKKNIKMSKLFTFEHNQKKKVKLSKSREILLTILTITNYIDTSVV